MTDDKAPLTLGPFSSLKVPEIPPFSMKISTEEIILKNKLGNHYMEAKFTFIKDTS